MIFEVVVVAGEEVVGVGEEVVVAAVTRIYYCFQLKNNSKYHCYSLNKNKIY